jgi:hypothetical protein
MVSRQTGVNYDPPVSEPHPSRFLPWPFLIVAAVVVASQAPLWTTTFHLDDWPHLFFADRLSPVDALSHGLLGVYFRPAGQLLWWVLFQVFGLSHVAFHLAVSLLCAATAWCLMLTMDRTGLPRTSSTVVTALVVVTPVVVLTAAWISNLYTVTASLAGWAALAMVVSGRPRTEPWVVALVAVAVAAKEDGLLFAVPVALLWIKGSGLRSAARPLLALALACGGFLAWRWIVLGGSGTPLAVQGPAPWLLGAVAAIGLAGIAATARLGHPALVIAASLGGSTGAVALLTYATAPPDALAPDLRVRFFYPLALAVAPGLAWLIRGLPNRWTAVFGAVGTLALIALVTFGPVELWRERCRASARLIDEVSAAISQEPRPPDAVLEMGSTVETGLDLAVKLRDPSLEGLVILRLERITFMAVPADLREPVMDRMVPSPLPGNPQQIDDWTVVLGRPPAGKWMQREPKGLRIQTIWTTEPPPSVRDRRTPW